MSQQMYIDCRVAGSNGDAVRVVAVVDKQNDTLSIAKLLPYAPPKDPYQGKTPEQIAQIKQIQAYTVIVVDSPTAFKKWDTCFSQLEHLDQAVKDYYSMTRLGRLTLHPDLEAMCNPESVIEVRKTEMKGNVYELDSGQVTNNHFAVLIACWTAIKMLAQSSILELEEEPTQHDIDTFSVPFSI